MTDTFNPVPPTSIKEITPEQVIQAFHTNQGYEFQVSIQKEDMRKEKTEQSINKNCSELSEEDRQTFISFCKKYGGRFIIHLYRLLSNGRSSVEKSFALDFIGQYDSIKKEIELNDIKMMETMGEDDLLDLDEDRLENILSSESIDSGMFWTFAPYLYKNLLEKGIESKNAIERIVKWGLRKKIKKDDLKDGNRWHLSGLCEGGVCLDGMYYLSINSNDITHKFTDQEAKKMVDKGII